MVAVYCRPRSAASTAASRSDSARRTQRLAATTVGTGTAATSRGAITQPESQPGRSQYATSHTGSANSPETKRTTLVLLCRSGTSDSVVGIPPVTTYPTLAGMTPSVARTPTAAAELRPCETGQPTLKRGLRSLAQEARPIGGSCSRPGLVPLRGSRSETTPRLPCCPKAGIRPVDIQEAAVRSLLTPPCG